MGFPSFGDFMGYAYSTFRGLKLPPSLASLTSLENSHVFYLGEDAEFTESLADIRSDLTEEAKTKIPMPFRDISCVSIVRKPIRPEEAEQLAKSARIDMSAYSILRPKEGDPVWVLDRVVEVEPSDPAIVNFWKGISLPLPKAQWFLMARISMGLGIKMIPMVWVIGYTGVSPNGIFAYIADPNLRFMSGNIGETLEQITAISHPMNYVVCVRPKLTPKEERRVARGHSIPDPKRPHFIVVDHEVLVRMRRGSGTHASPIPHERRGHWRRLAERCRHARLMGKTRTWVRPAFVGERTFSDSKNIYEVLPL